MKKLGKDSTLFLAAALVATVGCSTISRTEKQLLKVNAFDSPDIPAVGELPPARPRQAGLAYSPNTLIIYYDESVGNGPLKKGAAKYDAQIIYDYSIINAMAVRIPADKTLEESIRYFRKVKGVLDVLKDAGGHID